MRLRLSFIPLVIALSLAHPAFAKPGYPGTGGKGGRNHMGEMFKQLDLTPEQRTKIKELRQASREKMNSTRQAVATAHDNLRNGAAKADATPENLRVLHEDVIKAMSEMMRLRFEEMLSIRAILTPDQRAKFAKIAPPSGPIGPGGYGGPNWPDQDLEGIDE